MRSEDRVRLRHIADALESVGRFVEGRRREDLDRDQMLVFALVHALQIVGEAAGKMAAETRGRHPDIPWSMIIGMRHRLVHAYFDINLDILGTTAAEAAPALLAQVQRILAD
ncbi:MAG TPA: HepT-like ribonuclease domain-containing protein [Roseiarcus sp.]|nr:HepT-like ribonuclease domain-containing protein [Roseiarcus sp.]